MSNRKFSATDDFVVILAAARRNRARMMKVLFRRGVRALKFRFAQIGAAPAGNRVSHA
jgi:hypothetical protein